jgi:DNA modification methylase
MTTPTPFYDDGQVTIYHGDSREIAPALEFDGLVLTDPPYGISHSTDYKRRGRDKGCGRFASAQCSDYPPVHGDDEPFDPAWLLALGTSHILWGAKWHDATSRKGLRTSRDWYRNIRRLLRDSSKAPITTSIADDGITWTRYHHDPQRPRQWSRAVHCSMSHARQRTQRSPSR